MAYARREDLDRSAWKGVLAGMLGGLAASWTMTQFQAGLAKLTPQSQSSGGGEDATPKAGTASPRWARLAEVAPTASMGWGLPFGALAAHLVYGLTTDPVRRAVLSAL